MQRPSKGRPSSQETIVDERELVESARRGAPDAFEELVRRTSRMVFARCALEMGDPQRAEDLTQETYLAAWRSIRSLKEAGGFRGWLLRIAQNACIDARRRDSRLRRTPPALKDALRFPSGPAASGSDALDGLPAPALPDTGESRERALAILRSLPEEYRLPLTLRYLGGADFESIQLQMGISPGSLRGLLNRGLTLLRMELKRALGPEFAGGLR
ncbi:MAG TPA: sigma-70 family RNA polymerase sigma factor [Planctomycetota bacterium]|nr:sigma-70 family RNA polymerase sigma factor [Planctomycetota bacterium]